MGGNSQRVPSRTEWGELLFVVLEKSAGVVGGTRPGLGDHESLWGRIIDSIQTNRSLWFVDVESLASVRHDDVRTRSTTAHVLDWAQLQLWYP